MSISAIYILDVMGKVLISRNYRGDIAYSSIDIFPKLLQESEDIGQLTPLLETDQCTFAYIKYKSLYIVATMAKNGNVAMVFVFLHRLIGVMKEYFKDLELESIKDNFVLIYELLDELLDFGYPQTTETTILREYITQKGNGLVQPRVPTAVTNAVSWRSDQTRHTKNEVFLNVIESVNVLANAKGEVLQSDVIGAVHLRCCLNGMPELRLGLNDKLRFAGPRGSVDLEDVKFHQCVRLSRYDAERVITFVPPDGDFQLMSYRISDQVKPPFGVTSLVKRHAHSRVTYTVSAVSLFKRRGTASDVEILLPVPADADSPTFQATIGKVTYVPAENLVRWSIKCFPGSREFLMRARFLLPSVDSEDPAGRPPIQVRFQIPYFTASGLQVRYLKIFEKSGYKGIPWVKYLTQNGDYQLRTD